MKLNRKQHLLVILAEECNEVAQRVTKSLRFGIDEIQPGDNKNNAERIKYELNDLLAIVEMLQKEKILPDVITDREMMELKKQKVEHYLEYCKKIGTLTE